MHTKNYDLNIQKIKPKSLLNDLMGIKYAQCYDSN